MSNFPEDKLTLLHKDFPLMSQSEFITHVESLYQPYIHTKKLPLPKGKAEITPTKKRIGLYKVEYLTKSFKFEFTKEKNLSPEKLSLIRKALSIDAEILKKFLEKKNFSLTTI